MEAAPFLLKKGFFRGICVPPPAPPGLTTGTRAQSQERLLKVRPDCALEGCGKAEKQQQSPEATVALELGAKLDLN